jgi:hypothetical protein
MFLEFGDENRAAFLAFLQREYSMMVESNIFKQQLTHLIDLLPSEKIYNLESVMENMLVTALSVVGAYSIRSKFGVLGITLRSD